MKTSISFLKSNHTYEKTLELIEASNADFIHVDVMDGLLVNNRTIFNKKMLEILKKNKKPKDVHLMTLHLKRYIDAFSYVEPECITFQLEATSDPKEIIAYIKEKNSKVGIAINPFTDINSLIPFFDHIDLVLVMSVIPGYGGQKYLPSTKERIKKLESLRKKKKASFKISIDGGINNKTLKLVGKKKIDIAVSGSYVVNSADLNKQISELK